MEPQNSVENEVPRIVNADDLAATIKLLEEKKDRQEKELYAAYHKFQSTLTPQSLLRSAVYGIKASPPLRKDLFRIALGVGAGLISKKVIVSKKGGLAMQILGDIFEYGIATLITAAPMSNSQGKQSIVVKLGGFLKKLMAKNRGQH